jgi:hypothetical protein
MFAPILPKPTIAMRIPFSSKSLQQNWLKYRGFKGSASLQQTEAGAVTQCYISTTHNP